jgi:hypothetical protein
MKAGWSPYWLAWFLTSITAFLIPELWALMSGHTERTLSANVWALEHLMPGESLWRWTAIHVLVGGSLILVLGWLIGHLVFGIWRG